MGFRDFRRAPHVGLCVPATRRIWVNRYASPREQREIFAHELLHVLLAKFPMHYDIEEILVDAITKRFTSMLKHAGAYAGR